MPTTEEIYNSKSVQNLKLVILEFIDQIDAFALYEISKESKLNLAESTFNKLLMRTRLNLAGVAAMLDAYQSTPAMFHPIAHIVRSVLVDFLNFCYLVTFYDKEETKLASFSNELDHFNKDFIKSAIELASIEADLENNNSNFKSIKPRNQNWLKLLKTSYKHLFKGEDFLGSLKTSKEIRGNSSRHFFISEDEISKPGNGMLSEKYKYNRLLKSGFSKYADVYFLYKYFTQQYHFSNISNQLLQSEANQHNFFYLVWAINHVFILTDMQIQILDGADSKFLESLRKLEEKLDEILGE